MRVLCVLSTAAGLLPPYVHIVQVSRYSLLLLKSVRQRCALEFNNLL
ncbi:hypothetical protein D322_2759 [Yersinia enterocolitica IP 10393]|nr:hypothetical protein D322_2759 [Yersinia enterocolitica IP 10393]